jgi:xanthine/uracil permease
MLERTANIILPTAESAKCLIVLEGVFYTVVMRFDYNLDQKLPFLKAVALGLQWAVISASIVIILGKVAASIHFGQPQEQITYLQKLFFVTAVSAFAQVIWGHRLPVISGPATTVLIGVVASQSFSPETIYTAVIVGGLIITLLTLSGLFAYLRKLFTTKVVAVVLLLIAFILSPTILRLITGAESEVMSLYNLTFGILLVLVMFLLHRMLTGIWKSTLIVWSIALGSLSYFLLFPHAVAHDRFWDTSLLQGFFRGLTTRPSLDAGVLISFLFSYIALAINDIGSIQAMDPLLNPGNMRRRITRGMTLTGLSNTLAGFFGVIGPVNFSLSTGIIVSTSCASQYALVPAAAVMGLLAFSPAVINLLDSVPSVVIGCVLLYIATSQVASGLLLALQDKEDARFDFDSGLVIGLPVLLGTAIAFLPADILDTFPVILRPTLGNGFVTGIVSVLVLEHLVFRPVKATKATEPEEIASDRHFRRHV